MADSKDPDTRDGLPTYDYDQSSEANEANFSTYKAGIWELYNSGKPLFTKEALRNLVAQLKTPPENTRRDKDKYEVYKVKRYDDVEVELIYAKPTVAAFQEKETSDNEDEDDDDDDDDDKDDIADEDSGSSHNDDEVGEGNRLTQAEEDSMYEEEQPPTFEEILGDDEKYEIISADPEDDHVSGPVAIAYHRIQDLVSKQHYLFNQESAACTLSVVNMGRCIDRKTKKILTPKLRPYQEAMTRFKADVHNWEEGDACKKLRNIIASANLPETIDKIIIFSAGSVMQEYHSLRHVRRSNYQHALMFTLQDILEARSQVSPIQCFAQEPAYEESDKRILQSRGVVRVLDDPDGFLMVDNTSVVISCASNVPVKQLVSDLARPAIMVWDHDDGEPDEKLMRVRMTDPYSTRVRDVIRQHYDTHEFPGEQRRFGKLSILIRKSHDLEGLIQGDVGSRL